MLSDKMLPYVFLAWAKRMQFKMPSALISAVKALGGQIEDWQSLYERQEKISNHQATQIAVLEATNLSLKSQIADQKSAKPEKPLNPKERDSMLKLIIGMAMAGYAHDPKALRSPTASEIASDLRLKGLAMDEDTIRKYLNQGREFLLPSDNN